MADNRSNTMSYALMENLENTILDVIDRFYDNEFTREDFQRLPRIRELMERFLEMTEYAKYEGEDEDDEDED